MPACPDLHRTGLAHEHVPRCRWLVFRHGSTDDGDGLRAGQRPADVLRDPRRGWDAAAPAARRAVQHRPAVRGGAARPGAVAAGDRRGLPGTRPDRPPRPSADQREPGVGRRGTARASAGPAGRRVRVQRGRRCGSAPGHQAPGAAAQADRLVGVVPSRRCPVGERRGRRPDDGRHDRRYADGAGLPGQVAAAGPVAGAARQARGVRRRASPAGPTPRSRGSPLRH